MATTNVIKRDISEMEKYSIQKGQHVPKDRKRFGKLEFVVSILRADTHTHTSNHYHQCCVRVIESNMFSFLFSLSWFRYRSLGFILLGWV